MASKLNKNKVIAVAQKYVQKGQYDKAIREYTKIVDEDPRDVRIWLKIGDLYAKKNSRKEAVDTYSKVAEFYSEQGFYLKAVAVHKQILKIDNDLVETHLRLAELYKQLGLLSDAMQQYEHVSNHYNTEGRTKEALAALRQIVDLDPENVASRIKLAELYSKEGMAEEAVEEFSKAADFLRAENRMDDFVKVAERLAYHQPENMGVTRELASIYLERRDPRRALQKLQLAFKSDPRDEQTLEMLAQAFEDLGQTAKTVSVLKELASIHAETGRQDRVRETWQRILRLSPGDEDALKALEAVHDAEPPPAAPDYPGPPAEPAYAEPAPAHYAAPEPAASQDYAAPAAGYYGEQVDEGFGQPLDDEIVEYVEPSYEEVPPSREHEVHDPGSGFDAPETFVDSGPGFDEPGGYQQPPPGHYDAPEHLDEPPAGYDGYDHGAPGEAAYSGHEHYAQEQYGDGQYPPRELPAEDDVAKIITEADVYLKYGLQDKAIEHLLQVFNADPGNLEVHLKLREVYIQLGRYHDASRVLVALGQIYQEADPRQAAHHLNEALELDPDNHEARGMLNRMEGSAVEEVVLDYGEDEYEAEPIDLDAADIVEEIPIESSDLLEASELTPVGEEELYATSPGAREAWDDGFHADDYSVPTDAGDGGGGIDPLDTIAGVAESGSSGVIEVHGETTDTLGAGTPASEVIPLGGDPQRIDSQVRAWEEEESTRIEDDLEEAEFFMQQNLLSEARSILDEVFGRVPDNPLVQAKMAELETLEQQLAAAGGAVQLREDTSADLASHLAAELDEAPLAEPAQQPQGGSSIYTVEDVFEEFKRGGEQGADDEDSDTHYDLGIAYREMGLLDDAITEFKVAMRSREKEVLCHMMIGLCYVEKDMLSEAISQFKTGLYVEGITERETIALYFELGQAYERLEDYREALYYYEKVAKKDPRFREVSQRIEQLRAMGSDADGHLRVDGDGGGNPGSTGGNGNVVSKVV